MKPSLTSRRGRGKRNRGRYRPRPRAPPEAIEKRTAGRQQLVRSRVGVDGWAKAPPSVEAARPSPARSVSRLCWRWKSAMAFLVAGPELAVRLDVQQRLDVPDRAALHALLQVRIARHEAGCSPRVPRATLRHSN
jgi:hypothetical protein